MSDAAKPAAVVIGIGAVARGDDGFGAAVLGALYDLPGLGGRVRLAACDGEPARLIELWDGFEHAIIVDTTRGGAERYGYVYRDELPRRPQAPVSGGFAPNGRRCGPTPFDGNRLADGQTSCCSAHPGTTYLPYV